MIKFFTLFLIFATISFTISVSASEIEFDDTKIGEISSKEFSFQTQGWHIIDSIIIINQYFPESNNSISFQDFNTVNDKETTINLNFQPIDNIDFSAMLAVYYKKRDKFGDTISAVRGFQISGKGILREDLIDYYSGSNNTFGKDLYDALNSSIAEHKEYSYRDARTFMYESHDNQNGKLFCVYTDRSIDHTSGIPNVQTTRFNTEHTWPQSKGSDNEPERSDMHHIFPTYDVANSTRASYIFGNIEGNPTWEENGSKLGSNSDGEIAFEVRDEQKGNSARAMMYFATKYGNYESYIDPMNEVLREWNEFDIPDDRELQRNDDIFSVQENRNPYIDNWRFANRFTDFQNFEDPRDSNQIVVLLDTLYLYDEMGTLPIYYYGKENLTLQINEDKCENETGDIFIFDFEENIKTGSVNTIGLILPVPTISNSSSNPKFDTEYCFELVFSDGTRKQIVVFYNEPKSVKYDIEYLAHPNPANDFININPKAKNIVLRDQLGNQYSTEITNGKLNVSKLSTGIYFISYELEGAEVYTKFIKE